MENQQTTAEGGDLHQGDGDTVPGWAEMGRNLAGAGWGALKRAPGAGYNFVAGTKIRKVITALLGLLATALGAWKVRADRLAREEAERTFNERALIRLAELQQSVANQTASGIEYINQQSPHLSYEYAIPILAAVVGIAGMKKYWQPIRERFLQVLNRRHVSVKRVNSHVASGPASKKKFVAIVKEVANMERGSRSRSKKSNSKSRSKRRSSRKSNRR